MRIPCLALCVLSFAVIPTFSPADASEPLKFTNVETFGISGFRQQWNQVIPLSADGAHEFTDAEIKDRSPSAIWDESKRGDQPGKLAFDALQRSLLVRFPGAAEAIAEKVNSGYKVEKIQLHLPFQDTELWPVHGREFWDPQSGGYTGRRNWDVDKLYRKENPTWHAIAWALRRPWSGGDANLSPTFNAFIKGAGYWAKYGAQDEEKDRFPMRFGPAEVSYRSTDGVMDITKLLEVPEFGATIGDRLRVLSDNGFLVQKLETYDHRFFTGVYEWATATGGRAILINEPFLTVEFAPTTSPEKVTLPPAANIPETAQQLRTSGEGGQPTAVMPTREQIFQFHEEVMARPEWMSESQHQRVLELLRLQAPDEGRADRVPIEKLMFFDSFLSPHVIYNLTGRSVRNESGASVWEPADEEERYAAWVDSVLARQPRGWDGFNAAREMMLWFRFGHTLPAPAQDVIREYWTAWLMPDRETHLPVRTENLTTEKLIHPMMDQLEKGGTAKQTRDSYWEATGDWRGNKSFFRSGFCYDMSTQNFNMTSSTGALLGGVMIDSELAIRDGRAGIRNFPLGWAWGHGSTQEHIDHYYYAITLSGSKAIRDYAPPGGDQLLGESILAAGMEELAGAWHPGLRRIIAPSSRTHLSHLLGTQDGLYSIAHVLSKNGALADLDKEQLLDPKVRSIGEEVPPRIIANQSFDGPWMPSWAEWQMEEKSLPFLARHTSDNILRTAYMGKNYGLASADQGVPRIKIMAQWKADSSPVDQVQQITTMVMMPGVNHTNFVDTASGFIGYPGSAPSVQKENKLLVVTSPYAPWTKPETGEVGLAGDGNPSSITSFQSSIALYNNRYPDPGWNIFVFDPSRSAAGWTKVEELPFETKQGNIIAIQDGETFFAAVPLPSSDLGRKAEVELRRGDTQVFSGMEHTAALVIDNFNMQVDQPLTAGTTDAQAINAAYGGFYLELADIHEFPSFEAFQKHLEQLQVKLDWESTDNRVSVAVNSGKDTLELRRRTVVDKENQPLSAEDMTILINGESPKLKAGIQRDTNYAVISRGRKMEKGGATLLTEPGQVARLVANPERGIFETWNPRPSNGIYALTLPGGVSVLADGRVPLMRLVAFPSENRFFIDYAWATPEGPIGPGAAHALYFGGMATPPSVTVNGKVVDLEPSTLDGKPVFVLPLAEKRLSQDELEKRMKLIASVRETKSWPNPQHHPLRAWDFLTGLPGGKENFEAKIGPELLVSNAPLDLSQGSTDADGAYVDWKVHAKQRGVGGWRSALEGIGRKVGDGNALFSRPDERPATYFFYTQVEAERDMDATAILNTSASAESVLAKIYVGAKVYEPVGPGNNRRANVHFRKGINPVLIKLTQTEDNQFDMRFSLGSAIFGWPLVEGLYYRLPDDLGLIPVTPGPDDPRVVWTELSNGVVYAEPAN